MSEESIFMGWLSMEPEPADPGFYFGDQVSCVDHCDVDGER